jgi:rhodanese-related sulfurtransferase
MNVLTTEGPVGLNQDLPRRNRRGAARGLCIIAAAIAVFMNVAPATAYDEALAATYEKFFATFAEQDVAKALHFMPVEKIVEKINRGEDVVLIDVRTQKEQSLIGLTYPQTLHFPMNEVFRPENLDQIPTAKTVVVTCHSGVRCTAVALGLRSIGFENVYAMKGGLSAFMKYVDAKTAFLTGGQNGGGPGPSK